jgi:hypothetical protein
MVLSAADKREIADMFNAFADRMGPGRQYMTPEEKAIDILVQAIGPRVRPGLETFSSRMGSGRQYTPIGEQIVGTAIETALIPSKRKKAMTKFNKAVKEGMKIVRSSSSYGKKGNISNSKKAFSAVTKAVSKARKGGKLAKKGVLRKIGQKAKQILGKEIQLRKKGKRPGSYYGFGKKVRV